MKVCFQMPFLKGCRHYTSLDAWHQFQTVRLHWLSRAFVHLLARHTLLSLLLFIIQEHRLTTLLARDFRLLDFAHSTSIGIQFLLHYALIFSLRKKMTFSRLWHFILRLGGHEMEVKKFLGTRFWWWAVINNKRVPFWFLLPLSAPR